MGQQLDDLFDTWLFTPSKPTLAAALTTAQGGAGNVDGAYLAG